MEWPQDDRIHVDWLTPEQALRTMDAASGMERIIMHLELNLGMRRVEVIRQRVQDISLGYINVHGKGRQGGKWRTVPFHPDTNAELGYWFKLRDIEILEGEGQEPDSGRAGPVIDIRTEREALPISEDRRGQPLEACGRKDRDKVHEPHPEADSSGAPFPLAGVQLETISHLLGHEDVKTTILYLGINMDDMSGAKPVLVARYQNALKRADLPPSQTKQWTERDLNPRPRHCE